MYGGLVYASSNMMMSAALLLAMANSRFGTQLWIHASPVATEQLCMLLQSFGVSQMKFVPASKALMTSLYEPGSRFAHRAESFVIVVYDRNGKWSSPRGGLSEQPDPLASSANAFHVLLVFSRMSTMVGWLRLRWFPSPLTPKVLPPRIAM